jgi:hypothetical protein
VFKSDSHVASQLFESKVVCEPRGALRDELRQWEIRSASTLLLALERRWGSSSLRLSDVLREVVEEFAPFE